MFNLHREAQSLSHVGKVRDHNEDALLVDDEHGLYIVADGMGGHAAGEVASALAVDVVSREVQAGNTLTQAVQCAHHAIVQQAEAKPEQKGMGTTVVAVQQKALSLRLAWVGDSRIYRFTDNTLEQLSIDHSFVQDMVLREVLTEEQARNHPDSSLLRQALGKADLLDVKVDSLSMPLNHTGILLLCSDGVSDMLSHAQLHTLFVSGADSLPRLNEALQEALLETPASDNFTYILLRYRPGGALKTVASLLSKQSSI